MKNIDKILNLMKQNNNTITTKEVEDHDINRKFLTTMVRKGMIERVSHGIYVDTNEFGDEFFNVISQSKNAVFSHNTALYFHNLTDRTPYNFDITVPHGYNGALQKDKKINLFYVNRKLHNIGLIEIKSPQGKRIRTYNMERTICDLLRSKKRLDNDIVKNAIKAYLKNPNKNIYKLNDYAEKFKVKEELNKYLEVLL
jgi:predicted transcriptional regulator of viral defense system